MSSRSFKPTGRIGRIVSDAIGKSRISYFITIDPPRNRWLLGFEFVRLTFMRSAIELSRPAHLSTGVPNQSGSPVSNLDPHAPLTAQERAAARYMNPIWI